MMRFQARTVHRYVALILSFALHATVLLAVAHGVRLISRAPSSHPVTTLVWETGAIPVVTPGARQVLTSSAQRVHGAPLSTALPQTPRRAAISGPKWSGATILIRPTPSVHEPSQQDAVSAGDASPSSQLSGQDPKSPNHGSLGEPSGEGHADATAPLFDAAYLRNPRPRYPAASKALHEEGTVKLRVYVSADGKAIEVQLHQSAGFVRLDEAAIDAVQRWRFVPAQRGTQSYAEWVVVPISFVLRTAQ